MLPSFRVREFHNLSLTRATKLVFLCLFNLIKGMFAFNHIIKSRTGPHLGMDLEDPRSRVSVHMDLLSTI